MHILHISKYYHPFRGGIEKVIQELSHGMHTLGHEVKVLSSNVYRTQSIDSVDGVEVIRLPRWGVAYSQPLVPSLFWQIRNQMKWADIIHMHTPNPLAELAYVMTAGRKPVVTTYHCDVIRQRKLMFFYEPVAQEMLRRSQRIVVSTPKHLEFSQALQPHMDKCSVVPFGVEAKFAQRTLAVNNHVKRLKDELGDYFLFIGRLVPYKGVDVMLRALTQVKGNLVCIGKGPRWEVWNQLAEDLGVAHRVRFLGQVEDEEEFAAYIHGCQSLVLPSVDESEAFGIVLIEAMACGKPVITTALKSGVSWVNDKGITGIEVAPREWEPLAQAMNIMNDNVEMRLKMGEAARQRFEQKFQLAGMLAGYENIYMEILGRQRKAA